MNDPLALPEPSDGVSRARSLDELGDLRRYWDRFAFPRVDADPSFLGALTRLSPRVVRPHVAAFGDPNRPTGMLVARIEDAPLETAFGYKVVHHPSVRMLTVVHGGIADDGTGAGTRSAFNEVRRVLRDGEAEVALLPAVPSGSPLYEAVSRIRWPRRAYGIRPETHHRLRLPDTFDQFMQQLRNRKRLETYRRKLDRDFGDRLSLHVYGELADLDVAIRDMGSVSGKTYQHGLGVAFADDTLHRGLTELGFAQGWLRVWVLYLDGRPISFWPGDVYGRALYTGTPGYDPAFASHRVGLLLLLRVIEDLCDDPDVDAVDFNFGDADYKRRFANESWEETDVLLFAPTVRAMRISVVRSGVAAASRATRTVLAHAGVEGAVKRRWRRSLAGG